MVLKRQISVVVPTFDRLATLREALASIRDVEGSGVQAEFEIVVGDNGLKEETRQAMNNIKTTLEAHGYRMRDLVKCTVMLADISKWAEFNEIYKTFFVERYPARSALGANGLALGAQVEIECIAAASSGKG